MNDPGILIQPQRFRQFLGKQEFYQPQLQVINTLERLIFDRESCFQVVMICRQFGKNEIEATAEHRAFYLFQKRGGNWVRTAPTAKPQLIFSKARLERSLDCDPILKGKIQPREGFMYQLGKVSVCFLSTDPSANVVGATASLVLSIDEAHKVDKAKFNEDFLPMAGFQGVPVILYGVAADGSTLLEETADYNLERGRRDLVFKLDAIQASALRPEYAQHFKFVLDRLGADHPIVLTQYLLKPFKKSGGYLKRRQIDQVLASAHDRQEAPILGRSYFATLDIAGAAEVSEGGWVEENESQDSTALCIFEVDFSEMKNDWPSVRLVQIYVYRGELLEDQQQTIERLIRFWRVTDWIGDARGIGEQLVTSLAARISGGIVYKADVNSVSEDCFGFLALVNNGQFSVFRPDQSDEYREIVNQLNWCSYKINGGDKINLTKPEAKKHIDIVKAFSYVTRIIKTTRGVSVADFISALDRSGSGGVFNALKG